MTLDLAQTRFLVLGAGGFIGLNLVRKLAAAGQAVIGYGHPPRFPGALTGIRWIESDLADTARLKEVLPDVDCVVHLASSSTPATSDRDPIADIDENLVSTVKLLQAMADAGTRRIIFLSSGGTVYGVPEIVPTPETAPTDPSCAYGIVKLGIEKYIRLFHQRRGLEYASLRVSNPFGPFQAVTRQQGVVASFISKAIAGETIEIWGDGSAERDFLFIDDLVDAICAAASHPAPAHTLNIGSGEGRKISDVLQAVERLHGRPLNAVFRPELPAGVPASVLNIAKARDVLGWQPKVDWGAGLEQTYNWAVRNAKSR